MKRCLIYTLVCCAALLISCDKSKPHAEAEPVFITVWHYYKGAPNAAFEKLTTRFNNTVGREKSIVVKAHSQGSIDELHRELIKAASGELGAQTMPDIFTAYIDSAADIDAIKPLVSLDLYFTKKELADYIPHFIEEGRFDAEGQLKVFPVAKSSEVFMINKTFWDVFARATDKTYDDLATWEDIVETAKHYYEYTDSLTPQKNDGKAFFGRDSLANYILVGSAQLGSPVIPSSRYDENKVNLNKDVLRRLWDNYYVPYINGYFFSYARYACDDAKQGDVIALVASSTAAAYFADVVTINDVSTPVEIAVLPLPNFRGTRPYAVQQGAGFAVNDSTPDKEAASVEFIKWLTTTENDMDFALESSYVPVKTEALDMNIIAAYSEKHNKPLHPKIAASIEKTIYQIKNYELYTQFPVKNGFKIRQKLSSSLADYAKRDREIVIQKTSATGDRQKAIRGMLAENRFEAWYSEMERSIQALSN